MNILEKERRLFSAVLRIRIRDPVLLLTPGSGMEKKNSNPRSGITIPHANFWVKNT
jgi:hypothetical protein